MKFNKKNKLLKIIKETLWRNSGSIARAVLTPHNFTQVLYVVCRDNKNNVQSKVGLNSCMIMHMSIYKHCA